MNIFWLDTDLVKCAQYHVDRHVVKMITEYAQILNSAYYFTGEERLASMSLYNPNHPCMIWVRESTDNWLILRELGICLYSEYLYRYGISKIHASGEKILYLRTPSLPHVDLTVPPLCMPEECKDYSNFVQSYRNYYIAYKSHLFSWQNRKPPEWL